MNKKRMVTLVAGALVAGMALGGAATGVAAEVPATTANAITGAQLRLGTAVKESGARLLDIVAQLTGKSTDEVAADRQDGKSFSTIAAEANVSEDAVVDAALDARKAVVSEAVTAGKITQEQADAAVVKMESRITERVQSTNTDCTGEGCTTAGTGEACATSGGAQVGGQGKGARMGGAGGQGNGGVCVVTE